VSDRLPADRLVLLAGKHTDGIPWRDVGAHLGDGIFRDKNNKDTHPTHWMQLSPPPGFPLAAADEPPAVRIRRAELAIAELDLDFIEWWGSYVGNFKGRTDEKDVREARRSFNTAQQQVLIAEARLQQALAEEK
jgi:hypothetical protein